MKQTRIIMGMPITIEVRNEDSVVPYSRVFSYFESVDARFSPYKSDSELSKVNKGLKKNKWSEDMKQVMALCEQTKNISGGYFDIEHDGIIDTSGLVKGWAIDNAAKMLRTMGYDDFCIEAGGDIQVGANSWTIGIRNPFNIKEIVKVVNLRDRGIATSGTYIRGDHIYNPLSDSAPLGVASLTVIGPDIYEADRIATSAYAMGSSGISFINALPGFDGYMIDDQGIATYSEGFVSYVA